MNTGPPSFCGVPSHTHGDAMTRLLYAIRVGASVKEAAKRFVETGCQELVVLDDHNELVGIVTQADLVRLLLRDDIEL